MTTAPRLAARALAALAVLGACSGSDEGSLERYCAEVSTVRTTTTGGALAARAREIAEVVPEDIAADWVVLTALFEQIAQADPNDRAATDAAYEAALDPEVQRAAESVRAFTQINCGFSLDDTTGLAPPTLAPPTTT